VNLFSLQGIGGPTYGSNVPLWTLSIEVQFYALYPLLLAIMWRIGNLWTLMLLLAINIVSFFAMKVHGELFSSYYVSWYLGALVAEGEAASTLSGKLASPRFHAGVYAFGFAILCAGCAVSFLDSYIAFQVWAVGFAVLLFGLRKGKGTMRSWWSSFFQWLGTFSYSIYIVHLPIVVLIHSIFFSSAKQVSIMPFYATLVAVVGCAYVFSFVFEKPALALSQMLKGKTRLRRGATQVSGQGAPGIRRLAALPNLWAPALRSPPPALRPEAGAGSPGERRVHRSALPPASPGGSSFSQ